MKKTQKKAFTLVELLVVIAVLAILATVAVPSYTAFIKKANISADEQELAQINSYLNLHGNVSSEVELKNAIDLAFGSEKFDSLSPRSAQNGYHYWYDVDHNVILLKTYEEVRAMENERNLTPKMEPYSNTTSTVKEEVKASFSENEKDSFRMFFGNYYLLDNGGSIIGEALNAILRGNGIVEKYNELNDIDKGKHKEIAAAIIGKLETYAIITDEMTFVLDADKVTKLYFVPGTKNVTNNIIDVSERGYIAIADSVETVILPDSIETVHEKALIFGNDEHPVNIQTSWDDSDRIAQVFKANSTNAIISLKSGNKYTIVGNEIQDAYGNFAGELQFGNPVLSFDIVTPNDCDFYKTISNNFYIAYDYTSEIQFSIDPNSFTNNEGGNEVSSKEIKWSIKDENDCISITQDGKIAIVDASKIENLTATVVATAVAGGTTKEFTVYIVRPKNPTFNFYGNEKTMAEGNNEIEIVYDNNKIVDYKFTNFNPGLNITDTDIDISCNTEMVVTPGEGEIFGIAHNGTNYVLTLLKPTESEGLSQEFTVSVGDLFSKTFTVKVKDISEDPFSVKKPFDSKEFLYRVGNNNPITLGLFFANTNPGKFSTLTITDVTTGGPIGSEPKFTATVDGETSNDGTWEIEDDIWENTEIQFTGTGVAKIQIGEASITVEVVDGKNVTDYSELNGATNYVLLSDIEMSDNSRFNLTNGSLYGNDFIFDVTKGNYTAVRYNGYSALSDNYRIYLNNGTLDNVRIIGNPFDGFSAVDSDPLNICNVLSKGNSRILNCFISYCAAPVRVMEGNIEITNTTLLGGSIANLDIRGGKIVLDNITTINQKSVNGEPDVEGSVGLGIMAWYENVPESTTITIKNQLTQYNYMSKEDFSAIPLKINGAPLSSAFANEIFNANNGTGKFIYENGGKQWINTGIFSMSGAVESDNIKHNEQSNNSIYSGATVSASSYSGYLYSINKENVSLVNYSSNYTSAGQGDILPKFSDFVIGEDNKADKTEGSKNYCYYENGVIYISFEHDTSKELFLSESMIQALKGPYSFTFTNIYINGEPYNESSIIFDESGEHVLIFEFEDPYNYDLTGKSTLKTHTYSVNISVAEAQPDAKNAEFIFKNDTSTEKITINNNVYISAIGVTSDQKNWGAINVGDKTIIYPIVEATVVNLGETQAFFPVFYGTVTITDYPEGQEITYGDTTTSMPSQLTVTKGFDRELKSKDTELSAIGAEKVFKYSASADASSTPITHRIDSKNRLCYASPGKLPARSEQWTIAQYQYTDNTGAVYYYYIGYHLADQKSSSGGDNCVTPDTLITLADGTQKRVDELTGEEKLLVWNLETGSYDVANIVFVDSDKEADYRVIHLNFSDGSEVKVISEHGFFDVDLAKYVYIDEYNYADYIGHRFIKSGNIADNEWDVVTLESVTVETETTTAWSPVTSEHLCYYTNGILSMPGGIEGLFNIFDVNTDTMSYDLEKMEEDIAKYGLYTYDDFAGMIPEEAYVAFNGDWLKVAIEKGILTWDDIARYAERYIPLM